MRPVATGSIRRLLSAVAALVLAGLAQELCLLLGIPRLGLLLVAPALAVVVWLWRPRGAALGLLGLALGIQLLLPLHTGGGRFSDWVLHYEVSLRFAGQANYALAAPLPGRTALFHQLNGAFLAWWPGFACFQVTATLLNSLWLWPAALLVGRGAGPRHRELALLGLGLGPTLLAYTVYPWPWAFAGFFLLSALWLAGRPGRLAAGGAGLALGGALLAHPGSLGYVLGLGAFIALRRRPALPAAALGAALAGVTGIPWVLDVTRGHLELVLGSSIVARQNAGPLAWLVTRPLLWAASVVPRTLFGSRFVLDPILQVLVLSLVGALLAAFVWLRGHLRLAGAAAATVGLGVGFSWLVWPPNAWETGMLDALYLGILVTLVGGVSRAPTGRVARYAATNAVLLFLFLVVLLVVSYAPPASDPNLALKMRYGIRFLADAAGPLPGALLALSSAGWLTLLARRLRLATPGAQPPTSETPP